MFVYSPNGIQDGERSLDKTVLYLIRVHASQLHLRHAVKKLENLSLKVSDLSIQGFCFVCIFIFLYIYFFILDSMAIAITVLQLEFKQ